MSISNLQFGSGEAQRNAEILVGGEFFLKPSGDDRVDNVQSDTAIGIASLVEMKKVEDLSKLDSALAEFRNMSLNGDAALKAVQRFNESFSTFPERATSVVGYDGSGKVVAFDRRGSLQLMDLDDFYEMAEGTRFAESKILQPGFDPQGDVDSYLKELVSEAELNKPVLDGILDDIAQQVSPIAVKKVPLKAKSRLRDKVDFEYGGKPRQLVDVARGAIIYGSIDDFYDAVRYVELHPDVYRVRMKDRVGDPLGDSPHPFDYRDMMASIELASGHVVEIQFVLKEMYEAKEYGMEIDVSKVAEMFESAVRGGFDLKPESFEMPIFDQHDHELLRQLCEQRIGCDYSKLAIVEGELHGQNLYNLARVIKEDDSEELITLRKKLDKARTFLHNYAWILFLQRNNMI